MNAEQLDLFTGRRAGEYPIPDDARPARCRSCGRAIVWTRTEHMKPIPLSLATVEERDGQRFAIVHFYDCPDAKEWSRKR